MEYPLAKLKVLDFSRVLAGPFAGRMLSDLGADVVKVEPPDGDLTRLWGRVIAGVPGYYHQQNAGKRNICIDLRADGARELVLDLVRQIDIVIENYRPDVMSRLGLGYDDLKAVNPRVVMLSISGFGHGGPESHRPAYAPIVHAEAGLIERASERGGTPRRDLPLSLADTNAALHGLVALLAAVILRARTGAGQHIDMAMLDASIATDDQMQYDLEDSEGTGPMGNDVWETAVGPVIVSSDLQNFWQLLITRLEEKNPTTAEASIEQNSSAQRSFVTQYMASLSSWDAIEAAMAELNLAWGRVRHASTLREQMTVAHRNAIVEIDDRAGGTRSITQSPYRFSDAKSGVRGPAPHRGEHNHQVLEEWLDLASETVDALVSRGVLRSDETVR